MTQKITPFLWLNKGKEHEAAEFYTKVFSRAPGPRSAGKDSKITNPETFDNTPSGTIEIIDIVLCGQKFTLMGAGPEFKFSEAISFLIDCVDQEEVDYYWNALKADGGEESQCGWLKDKFGLSWQVIPGKLNELFADPDKEKSDRAMQEMLKQKKIIIADLEKAHAGK